MKIIRYVARPMMLASIALISAAGAQTPTNLKTFDVFPDDSLSAANRSDLTDLITASRDVLMSREFAENAEVLAATYPALFYNREFGSRPPIWGVRLLQSPPDSAYFIRTPVKIVGWYGAAITGKPTFGPWRMKINNLPLNNWRSSDMVEKSCAVNTIAHEMTHTLIYGSDVLLDDTSKAAKQSRVDGNTASYVLGQLAQCTFLQRAGRITAAEVPACVPVFYQGQVFAKELCNKFPPGRRVALP